MEDKKLKDLFSGYEPKMSSGKLFIDNLKMRMEAVEIVRSLNARWIRRYRIAIIAAAVAGFIAGTAFTFAIPQLTAFISHLLTDIRQATPSIPVTSQPIAATIAWTLSATLTILTSITALRVFRPLRDL